MEIRIEEAPWETRQATLLRLRFAVFVEEQGVPPALEHDAHDAAATHLLALSPDDLPLGTARLLADGHIGRMAVLPPYRGSGIGTRLLRELLAAAARQGLQQVFLNAQLQAVPFYERLGFTAQGGVFDDAGIPHRRMVRRVDADDTWSKL